LGDNMKSIKLRIKSVTSTKQITKAMELVAASKLRKAQDRVMRSRPYYETLHETLQDIVSAADEFTSPYTTPREVKTACYVVIAGDRGLAGGYNSNLLKLAGALIEADMAAGKAVKVLPVGKKALEYCGRKGYDIYSAAYPEADDLGVSDCFTMARALSKDYLAEKIDSLTVCYTMFNSMLSQTPQNLSILPLVVDEEDKSGAELVYDTDAETVFAAIVPEYIGGLIYGALCESVVSEQGARRTAMESATKNAQEMIDDLSLKYNRARQGAITQEITEIVAGSEN